MKKMQKKEFVYKSINKFFEKYNELNFKRAKP